MPPRYAYWTIIVDEQPTAFRAGAQEELMPTFKRLQQKHPSAKMMWFQNGKLWPSRIDAQEAMRARGEMGRRGDERQTGAGFRDRERRPARDRGARTAWSPRGEPSTPPPARNADDKLDWKPKGEFVPAPPSTRERSRDSKPSSKPEWRPKGKPRRREDVGPPFMGGRGERKDHGEKLDWKPKGPSKPEWKGRSSTYVEAGFSRPDAKRSRPGSKPAWKPKGDPSTRERFRDAKPSARSGQDKLEWKPKGETSSGSQLPAPGSREKRKWVPKEEYKKSLGIEARRDKNWRPGGEHKDPRQKYKDAKKAKWTRFKQTVRKRWESKAHKKKED